MTLFNVSWIIDIEADTTLDAAKESLAIQRDPNSIATIFNIVDIKSSEEFEVNLEDYHE